MKTNIIKQNVGTLGLVSVLCTPVYSAAVNDLEQPNILVVVCEDISPYLGCYGDQVATTPNLDRFSRSAIRHTNMYTCVGVSSPSRYSLITGRYSSNDGANYMRVNTIVKSYEAVPPEGVKCYTEYMRQAGYYCTNNDKGDYQFRAPKAAWDEFGDTAHWRNAPEDQPFFAIFNLFITHESQIWERGDEPLKTDPESIVLPPYYPDTEVVRHDMAVMYDNIAIMDAQFQELLDELEASDRADNTIVIFYSDNGGPMPRGKREILDSGSHVPFLIRHIDSEGAGSVDNNLNMFVDIPATIMSLAGVEILDNIHGQAMYGSQQSSTPREYVFGATDRFDKKTEKRASIRDDRYQYIYNYMPDQPIYCPVDYRRQMPMMVQMEQMYKKGELNEAQSRWFNINHGAEELYDCLEDPYQINNLVDDGRYKSLLKRMRKAYEKEWIKPYNKQWSVWSEDDFIAQRQPNGEKQVVEPISTKVENGVVTILNNPTIYSISYYIFKGEKPTEERYSLYKEPISLNSGETLQILMERIGFVSAKKTMKL